MKAIEVENLSKEYTIGVKKEDSLRESLTGIFSKKSRKTSFTALNNLNFSVNEGEVVGIIGKNGAGKSTLLKVLSRITEPSKGCIKIKGRVASLLEVGTGFHPELTGRENIFLNGTILGMKRNEIKTKFDEIVAFSGVEKFLETPVKRYSSGMYVRLAFAVAANLEPEILIIDEVLAVGDAEFQKKCLGKMGDVAKSGRTVLFVSHNMAAVKNLCSRGIVLSSGNMIADTTSHEAIEHYTQLIQQSANFDILERQDRSGTGEVVLQDVQILDSKSRVKIDSVLSGMDITLKLTFKNKDGKAKSNFRFDLGLNDSQDSRISWLSTTLKKETINIEPCKTFDLEFSIQRFPFTGGQFSFTTYLMVNNEVSDWIQNAFVMKVEPGDFYNTGMFVPKDQGLFLTDYDYKLAK